MVLVINCSFYLRIKIIILDRRCYNRNGVVRNILRKILRTSWFSLSTVSFYLRIKLIILEENETIYNEIPDVRNILRKILRTSWFSLSSVSFYLRIKIILEEIKKVASLEAPRKRPGTIRGYWEAPRHDSSTGAPPYAG